MRPKCTCSFDRCPQRSWPHTERSQTGISKWRYRTKEIRNLVILQWRAVLRSRSIFDRLWLRVFFSPAPAPAPIKKEGFQPLKIIVKRDQLCVLILYSFFILMFWYLLFLYFLFVIFFILIIFFQVLFLYSLFYPPYFILNFFLSFSNCLLSFIIK